MLCHRCGLNAKNGHVRRQHGSCQASDAAKNSTCLSHVSEFERQPIVMMAPQMAAVLAMLLSSAASDQLAIAICVRCRFCMSTTSAVLSWRLGGSVAQHGQLCLRTALRHDHSRCDSTSKLMWAEVSRAMFECDRAEACA